MGGVHTKYLEPCSICGNTLHYLKDQEWLCGECFNEDQSFVKIKALQSQLTKATEQIDLLNEESLSRIGVVTHLETKLKKAEELIAKLEESLKLIINPIECPACSMDDPAQYVPCYCFEQWNTPEYRAQQAMEEIAKWRDGE